MRPCLRARARVHRQGAHSALSAAGLERRGQEWVCMLGDQSVVDGSGYWVVDRSFAEVPAACLRESLWRTVRFGKWAYEEDIMVLEGRAAVMAAQRVSCCSMGRDLRQFFLLDNMSLTFVLAAAAVAASKLSCRCVGCMHTAWPGASRPRSDGCPRSLTARTHRAASGQTSRAASPPRRSSR